MYTLTLLRHGQSEWNRTNRFTGWVDVDLSDQGVDEARNAAELMVGEGLSFDHACTSVLLRSTRTLDIVLTQMRLQSITINTSWRLNERHYGALQGLSKSDTARIHGEEQVLKWRRSFSTPPPMLERDAEMHPSRDPLYADVPARELPSGESLEMTIARVLPYWETVVVPLITSGRNVIIVAHGNSLRGLVKHFDRLSDEEVMSLTIPTGRPLVYKLDSDLRPVSSRYLGDRDDIAASMRDIESQGRTDHS